MGCSSCRHKKDLVIRRAAEARQRKGLPPLREMVKNVTLSVIGAIKHAGKTGQLMASTDIIQTRINSCKSCEFIMPKNRCKICGCFLDVKIGLAAEKCPQGKW